MATSTDRKVIEGFLAASPDKDSERELERSNGFLVAIYDEFFDQYGNEPFPAGRLNKKIPTQRVRGIWHVGEVPANRNLSDRAVVGIRLRNAGYIGIFGHPDYKVQLTEAGSHRAEELIASIEAQ